MRASNRRSEYAGGAHHLCGYGSGALQSRRGVFGSAAMGGTRPHASISSFDKASDLDWNPRCRGLKNVSLNEVPATSIEVVTSIGVEAQAF